MMYLHMTFYNTSGHSVDITPTDFLLYIYGICIKILVYKKYIYIDNMKIKGSRACTRPPAHALIRAYTQ